MQEAEALLHENEYDIISAQVIQLAAASGCTAYDCEFVALAQNFALPLVTMDKQILRTFPQTAVALEHFAAQ
jgi:predicted nucleic acid-binding protein